MGLFFYNHVLPSSGAEAMVFLQKLRDRGQEGLDTLKLEVSRFHRTELSTFLTHVLPNTFDEDVLAIVYQTAPTIEKMGIDLVCEHFKLLYKMTNDGMVSQEFFEESAACLIQYYDSSRGLNLLADLSKVIKPADPKAAPANDFKSDKIDRAMTKHLRKVLPLLYDNNIFLRASDSLRRIDLPESLGVMLKNRIDAGDEGSAVKLASELFTSNRLSERYIEVCRREMGDDLLLSACVPYVSSDKAIGSVARMAPIIGESTFHTPEFLSRVRWSNSDTTTPEYVKKFQGLGFDEQAFPLLANHVCNNLGQAMRCKTNIQAYTMLPDIAKLARRLGKEVDALSAFIEGQRTLSGVGAEGSPAQIVAGIDLSQFDPEYTSSHSMANTILLDVVDAVGIEALHKVAPDVNGKFVAQYISAKGKDLSRKEVFRLFPQSKGSLLENDLGM